MLRSKRRPRNRTELTQRHSSLLPQCKKEGATTPIPTHRKDSLDLLSDGEGRYHQVPASKPSKSTSKSSYKLTIMPASVITTGGLGLLCLFLTFSTGPAGPYFAVPGVVLLAISIVGE